ncbi:hypothetical protein BCV71DRAFT_233917 [Rhizopus microsporus]|uniref:Uncharacterized protein n=1 Tax=Rhizopus microsporus TaxID=58291 RepID=A0A1X0S5V2_RHIZD|nr:hypothetical protein BCV71DRAFT_233917 [Rhizopus microsporus]
MHKNDVQFGDNTKQTTKSPFRTRGTLTSNLVQNLQGGNERTNLKALSDDQLWALIDKCGVAAKYVYDYFQLIITMSSAPRQYMKVWPCIIIGWFVIPSVKFHPSVWRPLVLMVLPISYTLESIEKTCKILDKIEKEYEEYLLLRQLIAEVEERINLATLVQQDIKKPVRGGKYGLLLPEQINACLLEKTVVQYL